MLQSMLWVQFSLSMDIMWPIIVRCYHILSITTPLMTNKCTLLYKSTASGGIRFSGRRQSSTLIISLCSSCKHEEYSRMTNIRSDPHTVMLAQGQTQDSTIQQGTNKTLTIGPFNNTCEADEVSPEVEARVVA
jgi:hypothetical protein